jgi:carboxypeptidase Q
LEDAEMIQRMSDRNQTITMTVFMKNELVDREGRNAVGEITGSTFPNEVIVIGGHVDSWDVGQGAMDDADGIFVCFEAMRILKKLGIRPKRTIRLVWWNDEEFGGTGADKYVEMEEQNMLDHVLAFEADAGIFRPYGFGFTGVPRAKAIIDEIIKTHTSKIGVEQLRDGVILNFFLIEREMLQISIQWSKEEFQEWSF